MMTAMMAQDGEVAANYGATEAMPSTELVSREHLDGLWDLTEQGAGVVSGTPLPGVELKIIDIVDGAINSIENTSTLATGAGRRNPGTGQARKPRVLPRPREHAQEQSARPSGGTGTASGMSATSMRMAGSGSAAGYRSGCRQRAGTCSPSRSSHCSTLTPR